MGFKKERGAQRASIDTSRASVLGLIAASSLHDIALQCCLDVPPSSLRSLAQVSCFYRTVASANYLWDRICTSIWADKSAIPEEARSLRASGSSRDALRLSIEVRVP